METLNIRQVNMRQEDSKVFLDNDGWPEQIQISLGLIQSASEKWLSIGPAYDAALGPAYIGFWFSNGRATYRVDRWDPEARALVCTLKESEGPRERG